MRKLAPDTCARLPARRSVLLLEIRTMPILTTFSTKIVKHTPRVQWKKGDGNL